MMVACRYVLPFVLVGNLAFAADGGPRAAALSEKDWLGELPIVSSAARLPQRIDEAPAAMTVIDRETIRKSGARQLVDLLRLVPGIQVAPIPNSSATATYHGLAGSFARYMQVLIDGRSHYSAFFLGGVNWDLVPVSLDEIERIEVVRGSNSAAFGSNAFLGVVNVVTRHAAEARGAELEMRSGTQGVHDRRVRVGTGNDNLHVRVTADHVEDKGQDLLRDSKRQQLIDVRADWRLSLQDELQLQVGEVVSNLDVGSGKADNPYRNQRLGQQFFQLGWRRTYSADEEWSVNYYRTVESAIDNYVGTTSAPFVVPVDYGYRAVRDNWSATHIFRPTATTRVVWGGEYRTDSVYAPLYFSRRDDVSLSVARLFGNLEWRFARDWIGNLGGTVESDTNSRTTFAPRAAVNWRATREQTFRIAAARAFRSPSLYETRGDAQFLSTTGKIAQRNLHSGDLSLRPERIDSVEIGWFGDFPRVRLTGDVRVFDERVSDRILVLETLLPAPACNAISDAFAPKTGTCLALRGYNAQRVAIRGAEHQWKWQPLPETRVNLSQAFVWIKAANSLPPTGVLAVTPTPGLWPGLSPPIDTREREQANNSAPTHSTTLMLMQRLPGGFDLSATYYSVGGMKWTGNTRTDRWQRLDWRLAYPFRAGPTRGEIAFTVQSDGTPHNEYKTTEPIARRGFVGLRLEY